MDLQALPTERRNENTLHIDEVSTLEMVQMINEEDKKVAYCIEKHLNQIAGAIDLMAEVYQKGGRIIYCGAGTSGRMGYMDSAECPPTYGIPNDQVISIIAGGNDAMVKAKEGAEDSKELGVEDLKAIGFSARDILVGLAASGRTPYVIGALEYARYKGAKTISITCNEDCEINRLAHIPIAIYPGPEAITGSTRMKAGTVQKMVLNMLSTGVMVKTGKVYGNLMVNVKTANEKLVDRGRRIIKEITGAEDSKIKEVMEATGNDVSKSIFMLLAGVSKEVAEEALSQHHGHIKKALKSYNEM